MELHHASDRYGMDEHSRLTERFALECIDGVGQRHAHVLQSLALRDMAFCAFASFVPAWGRTADSSLRNPSLSASPRKTSRAAQLCPRRAPALVRCVASTQSGNSGSAATTVSDSDSTDAFWIRRCVELARLAEGQTRPNPIVGCVLVDPSSGNVIAEGFHARAGQLHAEALALANAEAAGKDVRGCTTYVSLEPCNHTGRTPPCSRALVRAGVGRVVVGMVDPDPRTAGGGVQTLRDAGIEVEVGVEESLCRLANEGFIHRILHKKPFGILKYAMTLDGKIATETGSSKWVTGSDARAFVHDLRAHVDAIVVGGETLRIDDARLTVRPQDFTGVSDDHAATASPEQLVPMRVVMTKSMDLPESARLWVDAKTIRTVVLTEPGHEREDLVKYLRSRHVEVHEIPGLSPSSAAQFLYENDALNILWECGGRLASQAIAEGVVQKVHAFIAPKIVGGGTNARSPVDAPALALDMVDARTLSNCEVRSFGGDILVTGYL